MVGSVVDDNLHWLKDDYTNEEIQGFITTFDDIPSDLIENDYAELQKARGRLAKAMGYSAVRQRDEFDNTVQLLGGDGIRSINADFNPADIGKIGLLK